MSKEHTTLSGNNMGDRKDQCLGFLRSYHSDLRATTNTSLLEDAIWLTDIDGKPCPGLRCDNTALGLDALQRQMLVSASCKTMICALNAGMGTISPHLGLRLRTLVSKAEVPTIEALIWEILRQSWPNTDLPVTDAMQSIRDQRPTTWQPRLPSRAPVIDSVLDISFQWLHKAPPLDKYLGFHDWSLYISEPFAKRPCMDTVRVLDVTSTRSQNRRIAVIASSGRSLSDVRLQYETCVKHASSSEVLESQWQIILCTVLSVARADTAAYIEQAAQRLDQIVSLSISRLFTR